LTTDVIHKFKPAITEDKLLVISKWGIVILGLLALGVALQLKEIINSLLYAYTIFTAGIIPIVIAGFWREKLKITNTGALTAIVVGGASALIMKIYTAGLKDADTAAALNLLPLAVSTILLFAVSWGERVFLKQKTVLK
jgi:Na+/proline symporter